jgi:hypothetical protein
MLRLVRAATIALLLTIAGCGGGLSGTSSQAAGQVAADALLYGGAALASAGTAPTDRRPVYSEPSGPELAPSDRDYVCALNDEEETVRARSMEDALALCGNDDCDCVDRSMRDELARYGSE